jgi:hypothetical protein
VKQWENNNEDIPNDESQCEYSILAEGKRGEPGNWRKEEMEWAPD